MSHSHLNRAGVKYYSSHLVIATRGSAFLSVRKPMANQSCSIIKLEEGERIKVFLIDYLHVHFNAH